MKKLKDDFLSCVVGEAKLYCYIYSFTDAEVYHLSNAGYKLVEVEDSYSNSSDKLYVVMSEIKRNKKLAKGIEEYDFVPMEAIEYFCKSQFIC